jgi:hypothetical protein
MDDLGWDPGVANELVAWPKRRGLLTQAPHPVGSRVNFFVDKVTEAQGSFISV